MKRKLMLVVSCLSLLLTIAAFGQNLGKVHSEGRCGKESPSAGRPEGRYGFRRCGQEHDPSRRNDPFRGS